MKKGLFLLYEGIGDTIFNSQVAVHVNEMKSFDIEMDILSYETNKKARKSSNKNFLSFKSKYPNQSIDLRTGVNIFFPIINLLNSFLFLKFILKNKEQYKFIHARSDYATFIALITKPVHKLPVYWDCRGHTVSEIKHAINSKSLLIRTAGVFYILPALRFRNFINSKFSDKVIFVSDALHDIYKNTLKTDKIFIIACPVSEKRFYFSEKDRCKLRSELKYNETDTVFIYSGSMVKYQFLEGLIVFFKTIIQQNSNKILILTKDTTAAKKVFASFLGHQVKIISAEFDEVNKYYNAADIGVLIREKNILNYVASPTKHGEYCLSGLQVVLNDTVDQSKRFSKDIGNYLNINDQNLLKNTAIQRNIISSNALKYYSRAYLNLKYRDLYTC
ncbi:MAG: hypothetical protein ACOH1X_06525 [Kaistella sp.]